jgi:acetone carboxylase, gamma subunit
MKVFITEALIIDLDREVWLCRGCGHELGSAREPYKHGMLVRARPPAEVHAPILDASRYPFTFAPDPEWVQLLEYCCPGCGRLAEVEYLPPGHPPTEDIAFDLDALKQQWRSREELKEPSLGPPFVAPAHHHKHRERD